MNVCCLVWQLDLSIYISYKISTEISSLWNEVSDKRKIMVILNDDCWCKKSFKTQISMQHILCKCCLFTLCASVLSQLTIISSHPFHSCPGHLIFQFHLQIFQISPKKKYHTGDMFYFRYCCRLKQAEKCFSLKININGNVP